MIQTSFGPSFPSPVLFFIAAASTSRPTTSGTASRTYVSFETRHPKPLVSHTTRFTKLLVDALPLRARLEPGNALEGIQEMSVLCRKLLLVSSGHPKLDINHAIESFSLALMTGFMTLFDQWSPTQLSWDQNSPIPSQPSQQVVECLLEAN